MLPCSFKSAMHLNRTCGTAQVEFTLLHRGQTTLVLLGMAEMRTDIGEALGRLADLTIVLAPFSARAGFVS